MTLNQLIKELQEEADENDWGDMEVTFSTADRNELLWLSIYDGDDGSVVLDIGESDE